MCEHVRCRRLQEVDCSHALCRCARGEPKVTSLTRSLSLSPPLTLCRRARRGTRSSSRRPSTRSARTSTLTRRGRRLSTRLRKKSSPACSTAARYYTRARARSPCSQPDRPSTAAEAQPLARGEPQCLGGAPRAAACMRERGVRERGVAGERGGGREGCGREGWRERGVAAPRCRSHGPESIPPRLSTQAQVLGDGALLPRRRPDLPRLLHLLLPLGPVHRRLRPALRTEGRGIALHLPRRAP